MCTRRAPSRSLADPARVDSIAGFPLVDRSSDVATCSRSAWTLAAASTICEAYARWTRPISRIAGRKPHAYEKAITAAPNHATTWDNGIRTVWFQGVLVTKLIIAATASRETAVMVTVPATAAPIVRRV